MRKLNIPKDSYVDVSYGWQSRGDVLRRRRRRRWVFVVLGLGAALAALTWSSVWMK